MEWLFVVKFELVSVTVPLLRLAEPIDVVPS